jgi:hypothetical protein
MIYETIDSWPNLKRTRKLTKEIKDQKRTLSNYRSYRFRKPLFLIAITEARRAKKGIPNNRITSPSIHVHLDREIEIIDIHTPTPRIRKNPNPK